MIFVSGFAKGLYKMGFVAEKNVAACSAVSRLIITLHPSPRVLLPLLWKISQKRKKCDNCHKKIAKFPGDGGGGGHSPACLQRSEAKNRR